MKYILKNMSHYCGHYLKIKALIKMIYTYKIKNVSVHTLNIENRMECSTLLS